MIFSNASVLTDKGLTRQATVVIEGEKIVTVTNAPDYRAPQGHDVYDLDGKTLMPGMVAGHLHITYNDVDPAQGLYADMTRPATYLAVVAARSAQRLLQAGFTLGIGAGSLFEIDATLKTLIDDGVVPGPRLIPSGREITTTGGTIDFRPAWWQMGSRGFGITCDGVDEFRKTVREETQRGVGIIKLYPEGGRGLPRPGPDMTDAELTTAASTAHDRGIKVRAHVTTKETARRCVEAGIDIIDHADALDEELIDLFARHGTFVVPSLYIFWASAQADPTSASAQEAERCLDRAARMLPLAQKAGIKMVVGDDYGVIGFPHTDGAKELGVYVNRIGISAREVLDWATQNGADMAGLGDQLGSVTPGKLADLLVVDGDPVRDIACVADPRKLLAVVKGGQFARNRLQAAGVPLVSMAEA